MTANSAVEQDKGTRGGQRAACLFAAVVLSLGTSLLNSTVIPAFSLEYPLDRDVIYLLVSTTACVFLAWASRRAPRLLDPRAHMAVVFACTIVGTLIYLVSAWGPGTLRAPMDAAFALILASRVWVNVAYIVMLCEQRNLSTAIACVALPYVTDQLLAPVVGLMGWQVQTVLIGMLTLCTAALAYPAYRRNVARLRDEAPIEDLVLRQPDSFAAVGSLVFANMLVFKAVSGFGLAWNLEAQTGVPVNTWLISPLAVVVAIVMLVHSRKRDPAGEPSRLGEGRREDVLLRLASFLVVVGFVLVLLSHLGFAALPGTVAIRTGNLCARILVIMSLVALGTRNPLQALFVAACGRLLEAVGMTLGTRLGHAVNASMDAGDMLAASAVVAVMLIAFCAYYIFVLQGFSYAAVIHHTAPVRELVGAWVTSEGTSGVVRTASDDGRTDAETMHVGSGAQPASLTDAQAARFSSEAFDKRCEECAREAMLTSREAEIMKLLARGRNGRYIEEDLCISYNTVKTHIKRIYTKLDVHSQQELIDLVS